MISYFNGKYLDKSEISISPDDRGFLFGDGVYEVIRSYHGKLFCFNDHMERLNYSLSQLRIEFRELDKLEGILNRIIHDNSLLDKDATLYIQITRGVYKRMLQFPSEPLKPTVYITPTIVDYDTDRQRTGINAYTVADHRWDRCDIKSITLLANVLSHQEAIEKGGQIGIYTMNDLITEGTHTSVFAVKGGKVLTHPANQQILSSITRKVVTNLCSNLYIDLIEHPIKIDDVYFVDELFIVGTTPEITPVVLLNDQKIGNGTPGKITQLLQAEFRKLVDLL